MQKHRISTNIGNDQKVVVEIKQDYDLLEILSLKFTQTEIYSSMCSDYGVVCGRISVNNGFGIPNARVSIFIPVSEEDLNDPVISALYPFSQVGDKNDDGYRYNLLPQRKQHGGHAPTGTFPDQTDILTREEVLEVYEKYYKYTVKTNDAGDFMIWGVPLGQQTIHVDVDLSDIGCFSLRPDDFIRQGRGVDSFENTYKYKSSNDIDTLPQIISFDKNIEVYPFWGNEDLCEIGITRTDFDLSSKGVKVQPKAYFLGSIYSDQGKNTVNKECRPTGSMGRKCDLTTYPAVIEIIRFTTRKDENNRPTLERFEIEEDIDESGSFVLPLPMNLDYVFTNEFGENEITNDPNKGIPTSSCYRFRISGKNETLGRVRTVASYLVPNIREYNNDIDKSYAFSTDWTDYPSSAISTTSSPVIFNNVFGSYFPEDYFYRFTYNKVYGVSSYMGGQYGGGSFVSRDNFLGIKEISPKTDEDCESSVLTPPTNFAFRKFSFAILLAIIINVFERIIYIAYIGAIQVLINPFQRLHEVYLGWPFNFRLFPWADKVIERLQNRGTINLGIVTYPECESCDEVSDPSPLPTNNDDPESFYNKVGSGIAVRDKLTLYLECDQYQFNRPTGVTGSTKFDYYDCDTNTFSTVTLTSGSTTTTRCVRRGTGGVVVTQIGNGNGSAAVIGECSTSSRITVFPNTCDNDSSQKELYLTGTNAIYTPGGTIPQSISTIYSNTLITPIPQIYYLKVTGFLLHGDAIASDISIASTGLTINGYNQLSMSGYTCGSGGYDHIDTSSTSGWIKWDTGGSSPIDYVWTGVTYDIYSDSLPLTGSTGGGGLTTSGLPEGCKGYNTVYDESIVRQTWCAASTEIPYSGATAIAGTVCTSPGTIPVAQVIRNNANNPCDTCVTRSGFSELRFGVFTIIPAAHDENWDSNFTAIREYARRKIVGKLFCEGIANYSFVENWLTGSLYMFPFKSKVRWDNEENLDLNYRGTRYCENLLYFKVQEESTKTAVKRFYYRSTKFNGTNFSLKRTNSGEITTLGHPTTIVDLGPRDEFIKEICVDPSLDPNCSVVRSVGATSFQSFKEMLGLYINYRMDTNLTYNYKDFFKNPTTGTTVTIPLPTNNKMDLVLNGDILQLISINNESGIQEFDLQNRNYGAYSPLIVDPDNYSDLFKSEALTPNGPLPINFVLGQDGYRIRVCLNEPGRLTESSQPIPFFYWDKKGQGFGEGVSQFWDFGGVIKNDLQGMTYNYKFTGFTDSTYNYVLFPMTKGYTGNTFDGPDLNEGSFDEEDFFVDDHLSYNNQYEGFTYLYATSTGVTTNPPFYQPTAGTLWTRVGNAGGWSSTPWSLSGVTYIIKPTLNNYTGNKQILSTPFLFYFGLRPGKTAVDKFIERFGPKGAFPSAE